MLERALCIINPAAGRGAVPQRWEQAKAALRSGGAEIESVRTERPGHATELAEAAANDGWPAVIAVGGDGTVQEVAGGLLGAESAGGASESPTVPLGIIPAGSGNDFVKRLDFPPDPAAAARALLGAAPRVVDAGRVGERFFVNGVGIGLDARIVVEATRVRRLRGTALYAWALLRALRGHRTPRMRVRIDGVAAVDDAMTMVTVTNGPCHGGGFWLCPDARIDDGRLDVLLAHGLGRVGALGFLLRALRAAHVDRPGIDLRHARRVEVTSDSPLPVHADGEIVYEAAHRVEIEVLPGALTVLG